MACFHPLSAYQDAGGAVFFTERQAKGGRSLLLPCGRCQGCRLESSRQWAVRCDHERQLYQDNCFITLTYDDCHLESPSLIYRDFQLFMKRVRAYRRREMRKHLWHGAPEVRFFMSGEYGPKLARPHFHACLFNFDFHDRVYHCKSPSGANLYTSALLSSSQFWDKGFSTVGDLSFESAAYVARYVMGKVNGDRAAEHYRVIDLETGEYVQVVPEFCHMSLKPGIGARWLAKFQSDVYPDGYVISNGRRAKAPRYYDKRFRRVDAGEFSELVARRELDAWPRRADNTDDRLVVKEQVFAARIRALKRSL